MKKFIITSNDLSTTEKLRLDHFLTFALQESKSQVNQAIKKGIVLLNNKPCTKNGMTLKEGDQVCVIVPAVKIDENGIHSEFPQEIKVLYEDEDVLVLNKPPHLIIHSAPSVKEITLVDYLKAKGYKLSNLAGEERYGIIHRLDKPTSGAIAVAKTNQAHLVLSHQLKDKSMGRYYLAITDLPLKDKVDVECKMGRNPNNRLKMAKLSAGRYSKTSFVPLLEGKDSALCVAKLYTGRTHQIRLHLQNLSRHILGDELYGRKDSTNLRLMLHAYLMYFIHPISKKPIFIQAPLFEDMIGFLKQNFSMEAVNEAISEEYILRCFGDHL